MSVSDPSAIRPGSSDPHPPGSSDPHPPGSSDPRTSAPLDPSVGTMDPPEDPTMTPWVRVAAWAAGVVVAFDVLFLVMIQVLAHPLAVFSAITLVGIALLRRRPRIGMGVLVVMSLVALTDVGSAVPHLAHPASGADFIHAVVGVFGRLLVLGAGVALWRRASDASARRTGTAAVGLLSAAALVATGASLLSSGQRAAPQDATTDIVDAAFEDASVASGGTLFVDNRDLFRHTYTVAGTDIDVHLDARQGERIAIDLDPGVYDIICVIPHHDFMTATLEVQ